MPVEPAAANSASTSRSLVELMREPVLGPLLRSRFCAIGSSVIGLTQVWSAWVGVTIWSCPVPRFLGIPCPGCGLSRSSVALLHGRWLEMLQIHAFAPFFMVALLAFLVAAVLPKRARDAYAAHITRIERRVPLAPALLTILMLYWIARVVDVVL